MCTSAPTAEAPRPARALSPLRPLALLSLLGLLSLLSPLALSACLEEGSGPRVNAAAFSPRLSYPAAPYGVAVGDTIADLSLLTPEGEERRLSHYYADYSKRLLLITTSAEWCTACIKEQPELEALSQEYRDRGLGVVVTLFQDALFEPATPEIAARWRERHALTFDVLADPAVPSTFSPYYDVNLTPMVMLVEVETMKIVYLNQGFDQEAVTTRIEALLPTPLPRLTYPEEPYGVAVGDTIADLSLLTPEGEERRLSHYYADYSRRLLLITTSAEWCTACIKEQPELEALSQEYRDRGLGVVVSLFQDALFEPATPEIAARWRERHALTFDVLADPAVPSTFSPYYDVNLTPMVMLVEVDTMKIVYLNQGFDQEVVEAQLSAALGP